MTQKNLFFSIKLAFKTVALHFLTTAMPQQNNLSSDVIKLGYFNPWHATIVPLLSGL